MKSKSDWSFFDERRSKWDVVSGDAVSTTSRFISDLDGCVGGRVCWATVHGQCIQPIQVVP